MLQELTDGLFIDFLLGNELLNRCAHPAHHVVRQQILFQYLLVHQIIADDRSHGFSYPSLLFGDDAGSERNPPSLNVFRRMRTEQHADGNVVGDVTDDATNQWCKDIGCDDH